MSIFCVVHGLVRRYGLGLFPFLFAALTGSPSWAQPDQEELAGLQSQLVALQRQLDQATRQNQPEQNPFGEDTSRVRSIGMVKPLERPAPVVPDEILLKLYDLSDLFSVSAQYPARSPELVLSGAEAFGGEPVFTSSGSGMGGGGMGGGGLGGGGAFNVASAPEPQDAHNLPMPDVQVSINDLVKAIRSTIDPEQWKSNHDGNQSITVLGNMLLVSARKSQHEKISSLVDLFREQWGARRTLAIRLWWIRSDLKSIDALVDAQTQFESGAGVIDEEKWKAFYDAAMAGNQLVHSVSLVGHNGQTLHSWSGCQKELVESAVPIYSESVVGGELERLSEEAVGLSPVIRSQFEGAVTQVTPMATRGGNFAILDVHSFLQFMSPKPTGQESPSISIRNHNGDLLTQKIDTADIHTWRLSTTLRCPKNRIVLAGSMIDRPIVETGGEAGTNTYLFAQVAIHTVQEDVTDRPAGQ